MPSQQNNNYKTIRYPKSKRGFPESLAWTISGNFLFALLLPVSYS